MSEEFVMGVKEMGAGCDCGVGSLDMSMATSSGFGSSAKARVRLEIGEVGREGAGWIERFDIRLVVYAFCCDIFRSAVGVLRLGKYLGCRWWIVTRFTP